MNEPAIHQVARELVTHAQTLKRNQGYRVESHLMTPIKEVIADARAITLSTMPDQHIRIEGRPYLLRWFLDIPGSEANKIYLHRFASNDPDDPHDHPWPSAGLLLEGELTEHWWETGPRSFNTPGDEHVLQPGDIAIRGANHAHWLERTGISREAEPRQSPLTLFVTLDKEREWGFWVKNEGFVPWTIFEKRGNREVEFHT